MATLTRLLLTSVCLASPLLVQAIDLNEAYNMALEHDAETHIAYNQLLASKELKPQALAALLPSINASASSKDTRQESENSSPTSSKSTTQFRDEGFAIALRQPLFNWGSFERFKQAGKQVSKAEIQYRQAEQALIFRVTDSYLNTLQSDVNLKLANDNLSAFNRQLDQAKQRFEVGLIAITDVHDAQARYDLSVATQIAAQDTLYSAQEALREIIQSDQIELSPLADNLSLSTPQPNNMATWESTAQTDNLSIEMARLDVNIAKKEVSINRAGHYPTVDVVASHTYSEMGGGSTGSGFRSESDSLGLELNLALFSGGKTQSLIKQAAFNHQASLDTLQSLQRSTLRETRDAFRGITTNLQRIQALRQAIVSNQSSLDASEIGLEVGTRTIVDVLDAQSNLSLAKLELTEAKKNYILSVLSLKKAAGALSVNDIQQVNQWLVH